MAISPSVSVSLTLSLPPLMCFLCEWKTERSYASAAHQTFTSCGALECKREKDRQERKREKGAHKRNQSRNKKREEENTGETNKQRGRERSRQNGANLEKTDKESVKDGDRDGGTAEPVKQKIHCLTASRSEDHQPLVNHSSRYCYRQGWNL